MSSQTQLPETFKHWQDNLAGKNVDIHPDDPQPGFYKMRRGKGEPFVPVAIRDKDGQRLAYVADYRKPPRPATEVWTWCASHPVSIEDARQAFETGSWPSDVPTIGDNSGDLSLAEEARGECENALAWLQSTKIETKTDADKAQNWAEKIRLLAKRAEDERKARVQPHVEAQREINAEFKPLIDEITAVSAKLGRAAKVWLDAENARRRREFEEAKRKAEEAHRRQQEEARRQAEDQGDWLAATAEPEPPPPMPEPPAPILAGGQYGRRTSGTRKQQVWTVVDYEKAFYALKDHPDMVEFVAGLARKVCKATKQAIPGVELRDE